MFNKLKIKYYHWVRNNCLKDIEDLAELRYTILGDGSRVAIDSEIKELEGNFEAATNKLVALRKGD